MSELDRVVEMFDGDGDVTGKTANMSKAIREIKALREVAKAARYLAEIEYLKLVENGMTTYSALADLENALIQLDEMRRG